MKLGFYLLLQIVGFYVGFLYADVILEYVSIPTLLIAVVICFTAGYYSRKVWP